MLSSGIAEGLSGEIEKDDSLRAWAEKVDAEDVQSAILAYVKKADGKLDEIGNDEKKLKQE